jgi:uncharacterized protein YuzE
MSVVIGSHRFEHVSYDKEGDVLYLRAGEPRDAASTHATPEGHAISFDDAGAVIGMTLVNARWLLKRDGRIVITAPERIETSAAELAGVLGS